MKKYVTFLLLSGLSIIILSSCRKKDPKVEMAVSGTLMNFEDDSVIPHATVILRQCKDAYGGWPICHTSMQTTTDAEGRFSFRYRANMKYTYMVQAPLNDSIITSPAEYIQLSHQNNLKVYATRYYPFKLRLIIRKNDVQPLFFDNVIKINKGPLDTVMTMWGKPGITYSRRVTIYDNTAKMWRGRSIPMKIVTGNYGTTTVEIPDMMLEPEIR
ncbi:carboxypeptidase-like regulatory domain-containing protein [Chitinophaga deserti]|uniref:carboxypeptidase-like regulatory domain-containing protein n=1 Tax=Chitinophaga deserti TaxID=2164099 RepID=UPI000D6AA124|nr:carboxypeptidase-like regulatory domain-containing protein [Chitinophaga deserti]